MTVEPLQRQLRIIGGRWRGRKVSFAGSDEIRPTPNRVRETLFNWLAPVIADARCLDAFAGSGILSFEALSRGAGHVTIVDRSPQVIRHIAGELARLTGQTTGNPARLVQADTLKWMKRWTTGEEGGYDVLFVDPPFRGKQLVECCSVIAKVALPCPGALVYIESPVRIEPEQLPDGWEVTHQKQAGQVHYCLCSVP